MLDFGLAVAAHSQLGHAQVRAGTLAYMAPELLTGGAPSERSDLFALGVMAYQLLAGRHPFDTRTERRLRTSILDQEPELDRIVGPPALREVIAHLLQKDPGARPSGAGAVALALSRAIGVPLAEEEAEVRDSFLQSAALVGRTAEMETLLLATTRLVAGQGGAILLAGESGVGKSRLLEEARVAALVRGALVLRGQATDAGAAAHLILRELLRHLVLHLEKDPTDFEAGVLLPLVPDLPALLGRDVAPVPELDARANQERLFEVVEGALAQLARSGRPVLLLLDDLQWVSADTLALLQRIVRRTTTAPILLLGTYRDDEAPHLRDSLAGARHLKLSRLDPTMIRDLTEAMLGPAGRRPELIELLCRETEGNSKKSHNIFRTSKYLTARSPTAGRRVRPGQHGHAGAGGGEPGRAARAHPRLLHGERVQTRTPRAG